MPVRFRVEVIYVLTVESPIHPHRKCVGLDFEAEPMILMKRRLETAMNGYPSSDEFGGEDTVDLTAATIDLFLAEEEKKAKAKT